MLGCQWQYISTFVIAARLVKSLVVWYIWVSTAVCYEAKMSTRCVVLNNIINSNWHTLISMYMLHSSLFNRQHFKKFCWNIIHIYQKTCLFPGSLVCIYGALIEEKDCSHSLDISFSIQIIQLTQIAINCVYKGSIIH